MKTNVLFLALTLVLASIITPAPAVAAAAASNASVNPGPCAGFETRLDPLFGDTYRPTFKNNPELAYFVVVYTEKSEFFAEQSLAQIRVAQVVKSSAAFKGKVEVLLVNADDPRNAELVGKLSATRAAPYQAIIDTGYKGRNVTVSTDVLYTPSMARLFITQATGIQPGPVESAAVVAPK